jgi:hypothetical protein
MLSFIENDLKLTTAMAPPPVEPLQFTNKEPEIQSVADSS